MMERIRRLGIVIFVVLGLFWLLTPITGFSYPVPELPDDNLITNPWFRSTSDPNAPGFDGWTPVLQDGVGWGLSQKESNPSPDIVIVGKCGFREVYCGTGARWAKETIERDEISYPGMDVYLYQVVKGDSANRKLKYFMYWVNHKVDVAEVRVYGSNSVDGQWSEVWFPFSLSQDHNPPLESAPGRRNNPWFQTGVLETTLEKGYPYYKIELHARYPEPNANQGDVGVKITGVYFAAEYTDAPKNLSTPVFVHNPTLPGDEQPLFTDSPVETAKPGIEQGTPQSVRTPSPVPSIDHPSSRQTPTNQIFPTPSLATSQNEATSGMDVGFLIGFTTAGVILLALLVIRGIVKHVQR